MRKFTTDEARVIAAISQRGVACATLSDARKLVADGFIVELPKRLGNSHQFRLTATGKEVAKRVGFDGRGLTCIKDEPVSPTNRPWDSPVFASLPTVQAVLRSQS